MVQIDEASVRIQLDTRQALAQARKVGEKIGRRLAAGINKALREKLIELPDIPPVKIPTEYERPSRPPRTEPPPPVKIPVDAVTADFAAQVRRAVAEVSRRVNAEIPLTADGERLRAEVTRAVREIERTVSADIPTEPGEAAEYRRKLAMMVRAASATVTAHVKTDVDRGTLGRIGDSMRSLIGLGAKAGDTFTDLIGSTGKLGVGLAGTATTGAASFGKIAGGVGAILAAMSAVQVVIPGLATGVAGLAGLALSAFGAIGAGVVGLPVLLTALLGPIAAIAIGMDGIKRAAHVLSDEMHSLRTQVNLAFEQGMAPVFDRLQKLFPTLSVGLSEIAQGVSRFALSLTDVVTSEHGIEKVRMALGGVSTTLDQARGGATSLFRELLDIAGTRELYVILGDTIGGVSQRLADMLYNLRASGVLESALGGLKRVLFSLTDLLSVLGEGAVRFFDRAAPGLTSFIDSLTRTLSRIDWDALGESFGNMMARLGAAIESVPPETWKKLGDAIGSLIEKFLVAVESGGLDKFIKLLAGIAQGIELLGTALDKAQSMFENITLLKGIGESIGDAFKGSGEAADKELQGVNQAVDEHVVGLPERITTAISGLPEQVGEIFTQVKDKVGEELQQTGDAAEEKTTSLKDRIGEALSSLPGQVESFFATLPDRIGYWLGYAAATVWEASQLIVANIIGWFATLPGRVEQLVADMQARAWRILLEMLGWLPDLARQIVDGVTGWFSQLPGRVERLVLDTQARIIRVFMELPGQLWRFAEQSVESFLSPLRGLPAKVVEWASKTLADFLRTIRELPGKMYQAGVDAIQGFINGIKDKALSLWQAAKDVVSGAIRGAHDAIESGSPSRVFRGIGHNTIDSYILGLRDRLAPLLAQMRAIMAAAIERAGVTLSGASLNLAGSLGGIPEGFHTATRAAVGTGAASGPDVAALAAAFTTALGAAQWRVQGDDLILTVNRAAERLARR